MLTFNDIIVKFDLSMVNVGRAFSFIFGEIKGSAIRCSFIRINAPWNLPCFNAIEYFSEKSVSRLGVATEIPVVMTDKRWRCTQGWIKVSQNINGIEIRYVRNKKLELLTILNSNS